jgi:acyl-coenzyme A thioesterase PaaI-like protein
MPRNGMNPDPPPGFELLPPIDEVMACFAPIHLRRDGEHVALGFRVDAQHCNLHGTCHGGVWACVADVQLGLNVGTMTGLSGPTISLSLDYLGAAAIGQWVEGRTRLLRKTPKLAFVDATFTADDELVLRASGIFRLKWAPERDLRQPS